VRKEVESWRKSSLYDLEAAKDMFTAGRHVYVIFFCHLSVEKMLKAVVAKVTGNTPTRTHNLLLLKKMAHLEPSKEMMKFIGELSETSIATRYPLDFGEAAESYTRDVAEVCLAKTNEVLEWMEPFAKG
jgi:HEPN domain-containing protein